ncbi:hypothetical protein BBJ28_00012152, partial [Nothophytophthora sp. Chile5]
AIDLADAVGRTPLMIAALEDHVEIVQLLLDRKASIDMQGLGGATALSLAAREGHVAIVQALIDAGATTDLADHSGWTPRLIAAREGYSTIVQILDANGHIHEEPSEDVVPLERMAEHRDLGADWIFVDGGAEIDWDDEDMASETMT